LPPDEALVVLERTEQRWYEAEMHRIRAEILLNRAPANNAAAEQSLQAAIAIAQSQKARSVELRAAYLYVARTDHRSALHQVMRRCRAWRGGIASSARSARRPRCPVR